MKKLGLLFKEASENRIKNRLKESSAFFIIKYSRVSNPDLTTLRRDLKNSNASFFIVKNSIAKRALKESGYESLRGGIEGACGLVFVKEDPIDASKILYNFRKDHGQFIFESGFLKDKVLAKEDIESMARLPSKEVLRAQLVMAIKGPISGLVMVLHQTLRKFVYCLDLIRDKKSNQK